MICIPKAWIDKPFGCQPPERLVVAHLICGEKLEVIKVIEKKPVRSSVDCQLSSIPDLESSPAKPETKNLIRLFKACFAKSWNHTVKPWLKSRYRWQKKWASSKAGSQDPTQFGNSVSAAGSPALEFKAGEWVRVKSREEIISTLDKFDELKGCAFLEPMYEYCGTVQKVYVKVERFLDERSFKVRSAKGLYFLENLQCTGTEVFGRCDRRCYYFWRAEWLEKMD